MEFNERQALQVIEEMISKTKSDMQDNSFYFLLWGWLVFIAAVCNYYLLVYTSFEVHSMPWFILMPLGVVITMIAGNGRRKRERVKTYLDETIRHVGAAFYISMTVVCFGIPAGNHWGAFYPTMMVLYALWLFAIGGLIKFKPLVYGAVWNWALALTGYLWAETTVHLILIALAVLGGYIVPGYLLKLNYQRNVQRA